MQQRRKEHYLPVITWSAHLNGQPGSAYLNLQPETHLCLHNAVPWQNYTARHGCSQIIIIDSLSSCQSGDSSEAAGDGQGEDWPATIQGGNFISKMNLDEMVPVDKGNWWLFQSEGKEAGRFLKRKTFLAFILLSLVECLGAIWKLHQVSVQFYTVRVLLLLCHHN